MSCLSTYLYFMLCTCMCTCTCTTCLYCSLFPCITCAHVLHVYTNHCLLFPCITYVQAYLRKGDAPYGPLTPHDIKRLTTQQLRQKLKAIRPIQKVLQTPTKELSSPVFEAQKVVQIAKTKFRVKVPRRLPESSGSDEDPVSVAVVKPIVSSESKSSSNNQQRASEGEKDRKKSSTVATSKNNVAEKGTLSSKVATASTKTAVASSVPHPLAQTVKAASKPALNQNRTTTKTEVAKPALATSQTSSAATKTTSTVCSSSTGVTSSSAAQSTPALSSSTRQATVTKTTTAEPVRRSSCGSSSSVPTNRKPAPPVSSSTSNHASSKTTTAEPTRRSSCDSSSSVPTNRKPAQPVSSSTSNHASSKTTTAEPTRRLSCGSSSSVPTNRKPAQPVSSSTSNHASSKPVSTNSSTAASKVVPTKPIQVDPRHQAMSTTAKGGLSTTSKTYHKLPVPRVTAHAATGNEVAPFVSRACRNQSNEYRKDHLSQLPQQQGSHHHYLPPPPRPPQPLVPPPSHYSHYQYPYHPLQSQGMWMNGTWYMYGNCALNW